MQAMAAQLGGSVEAGKVREFGYAQVRARDHSPLLREIQDRANADGHGLLDVWMSHGDKVTALPPGFRLIGSSDACAIAAMADETRRFYGVQFHPEVTHTKQGTAILARFAHEICGCGTDWNMHDYVDEAVAAVRAQTGGEDVLLGLSGGVDSSVAAALLHRAVGDRLTCVFVDHGLLRLHEAEQVMHTFAQNLGVKVIHVDASARIPGRACRRVGSGNKAQDHRQALRRRVPARGGEADQREVARAGHHLPGRDRVGGRRDQEGAHDQVAPQRRRPARIAAPEAAGAAARVVQGRGAGAGARTGAAARHGVPASVPGPGLGVRILGDVTRERAELLRRADAIFIDELRAARDSDGKSWYDKTAQAFAVFLPVRSVGVMGDGRTYENAVALRAVQTTDFMTAHWAPLPHELLVTVSNRITNEVRGFNRVVYDISSKPPATIEWE